MEKTRIQHIDITRGIAIICIILGHLGNAHINSVVFTFHVPVFFFITGYFTNTNLCIKDFIKNKTRTLLVPYVFTSFLIILLSTLEYLVFVDKTAFWQALTGWLYAWISPIVLCYLWKIYCYYFRYNNLRKLEPAP